MYLMALHTGHTQHSNYDKCSARSLKDLCMNLPTHVNICGFLLHIRNRNFSSSFIWVKFGTKRANLENRFSLSGWLMVQFMTKCLSSSRTWQTEQLRSSIFVLGRVYLPYSIARVCELVLNWDMATLSLWFLIASKYISMPKLCFKLQ